MYAFRFAISVGWLVVKYELVVFKAVHAAALVLMFRSGGGSWNMWATKRGIGVFEMYCAEDSGSSERKW